VIHRLTVTPTIEIALRGSALDNYDDLLRTTEEAVRLRLETLERKGVLVEVTEVRSHVTVSFADLVQRARAERDSEVDAEDPTEEALCECGLLTAACRRIAPIIGCPRP